MLVMHTIGHSTRDFDEVVGMLKDNTVSQLVDVRSFPSSRTFPQWNRENIQSSLPPDIGYQWIQALGGRRHTAAGVPSPNGAWRVKAFRDYADYMSTDAFEAGLDELVQVAARSSAAIMCSEAVPWRCHRRLITDALLVRGVTVYNIMSSTVTQPAELTSFAHVDDGRITYPPMEGAT
jgi:uncharacterized protein (DUF488 family)